MAKRSNVVVVQKQGVEPVPAQIIAQSIEAIAKSVDSLTRSDLSHRAIVLLLSDASKESRTTVENVLQGLKSLRLLYLRK